MFARKVTVECLNPNGTATPVPIAWIDNFAMRNFTNDKVFDDTLPVGDGRMEVGHRVPLEHLECAIEDWFRKKGYVKVGERVVVREEHGDIHNNDRSLT
jgi:hypothetical protein